MKHSTKEEPNTKNVIIWPENIRNQIKLVEEYDKLEKYRHKHQSDSKKIHSREEQEELGIKKTMSINNERIEYYIFLIFGSLIWLLVAHTILKWHQFPFHKHVIESLIIYFCPLIAIILVLFLLDFGISLQNAKKHN
jgi:hypothetical protein